MKKFLLFLGILLISFNGSATAYSRLISLKPNITEIIFALGSGDKLIGVTSYCKRPDAAQKILRVADYLHADTEKILSLKPDLILTSRENSVSKEIIFLEQRGLKVELLNFSTLNETLNSISTLGKVLGKEAEAQAIRQKMEQDFANLKQESQKSKRQKVLFVVGYQPLVVAGSGNFFQEAADILNLENAAGLSQLKYPTYSTELLIHAAPEVIIDLAMGSETAALTEEKKKWWNQFASIPAVKNKKIYSFDIEKMRAAPSLPGALRELKKMLSD